MLPFLPFKLSNLFFLLKSWELFDVIVSDVVLNMPLVWLLLTSLNLINYSCLTEISVCMFGVAIPETQQTAICLILTSQVIFTYKMIYFIFIFLSSGFLIWEDFSNVCMHFHVVLSSVYMFFIHSYVADIWIVSIFASINRAAVNMTDQVSLW